MDKFIDCFIPRAHHAPARRDRVRPGDRAHGDKLASRFDLKAYLSMNHLLASIDICLNRDSFEELISSVSGNIFIVSIDTDLFFPHEDNRNTYRRLLNTKPNVFFKTITSIHGHDAFLIEFEQLTNLLKEVFNPVKVPS